MTDPQTVEELDAQVKDLRTQRRALKEAEHQRKVLLPQLSRKRQRLTLALDKLNEEDGNICEAIKQINAGEPTDYRVRAPRKPKKPVATP